MPVDAETLTASYTRIRAARGGALSCKGWQQEAALRMLMNNLDEEVAERPRDLVVYGGTGKIKSRDEGYRAGMLRRSSAAARARSDGHIMQRLVHTATRQTHLPRAF